MAPSTQVRLNALRKTQSAISTQMVSHGNVWLLFSRTLRPLFGGIRICFEHDGTAMTQWKDCTNQSKCLHATATFAFEQFQHMIFFLDVDRIHSSEKEKQQNPKSWVQFCWCFFLWLVVRYSFASCQNVATQHHPAGLSMLDLWSGAVHDLQSE